MLRLEPRGAESSLWRIGSPVLALVLTTLTAALIFAAMGRPPFGTVYTFLVSPLLAPGGTALFPKGANAAAELEQARRNWDMQVVEHASPGQPGVILAITGLQRIQAGVAHA